MLFSLLLLLAAAPASATAGTPGLLGYWTTPDKSIAEVLPCGSALCIRIAHVDKTIPHSTDGMNPDASQRSRPLCGLTIGTAFTIKDPAHAEGGRLYDPESGKTYKGTLALESADTIKLRGYVGVSLFGRNEIWHRAPGAPPHCG